MGTGAKKASKNASGNAFQLSLFENSPQVETDPASFQPDSGSEPAPVIPLNSSKKPTMIDLLRDRFENDAIAQEDYKKWIRFLVQNSFKSIK